MSSIPHGRYQVECVLIDFETVFNNEGVQELEISNRHWTIGPANQRFEVLQHDETTAELSCYDKRYNAEFELNENGDELVIHLRREGVPQVIRIDARRIPVTITA